MLETLQQLDTRLFLTLNALHSPYWDTFMFLYTSKLVWIPLYASILYVLCRNLNVRMVVFTTLAFVLLITLADQTCSSLLRPAFERFRPSHNPEIADMVHLINNHRGGRFGFPSCHAANTFALAFFITWLFRHKVLSVFFMAWAIVTCYSRVYVGVHYPGDLLFGMTVGFAVATLVYGLYRFLLKNEKIACLLRYSGKETFVESPFRLKQERVIIYTGILTVIVFPVYSFFS